MKYEAGFSWDSKQGKKVVAGAAIGRPDGWLMVTVDGTNFYIHEDDIENEIAFDSKNLEAHKRWIAEDNARREKEMLARAEYNDVDGFDALSKTPIQAGLTRKVLNTLVNYNGHIMSRKSLIREKLAEGWYVEEADMTLNGPDGRYLSTEALTKTGIKYALFLTKLNTNDCYKYTDKED